MYRNEDHGHGNTSQYMQQTSYKGISLRNLLNISYFHTCQLLQEVSVARLAHLWDL